MSINKVILLGRLTKDVELRYTSNSKPVANFTIATSDKYKDSQGQWQEKPEFTPVFVWGKLGEMCNKHLSKGKQVYVEGKLETRFWDAKDGTKRYITEVRGYVVEFVNGLEKAETQSTAPTNQIESLIDTAKEMFSVDKTDNFTTDEIPF